MMQLHLISCLRAKSHSGQQIWPARGCSRKCRLLRLQHGRRKCAKVYKNQAEPCAGSRYGSGCLPRMQLTLRSSLHMQVPVTQIKTIKSHSDCRCRILKGKCIIIFFSFFFSSQSFFIPKSKSINRYTRLCSSSVKEYSPMYSTQEPEFEFPYPTSP